MARSGYSISIMGFEYRGVKGKGLDLFSRIYGVSRGVPRSWVVGRDSAMVFGESCMWFVRDGILALSW